MVNRGAHLVEVGIPYSDPIADGPVIAASYHRALERGVKVGHIFQTLRTLRAEGSGRINETPLVAMVSYAIIHRLGTDRFLNDAATAGLDGLIVPDLPVEESAGLMEKATARGLKLIQLITPTTPRERAVQIARSTTGFVYYVSVAGITGERQSIPAELVETVGWLRTQTDLPICIGFGISGPDQVRQLAPVADGLIVGSAIVPPAGRGNQPPSCGRRPRDRPVRGRAGTGAGGNARRAFRLTCVWGTVVHRIVAHGGPRGSVRLAGTSGRREKLTFPPWPGAADGLLDRRAHARHPGHDPRAHGA